MWTGDACLFSHVRGFRIRPRRIYLWLNRDERKDNVKKRRSAGSIRRRNLFPDERILDMLDRITDEEQNELFRRNKPTTNEIRNSIERSSAWLSHRMRRKSPERRNPGNKSLPPVESGEADSTPSDRRLTIYTDHLADNAVTNEKAGQSVRRRFQDSVREHPQRPFGRLLRGRFQIGGRGGHRRQNRARIDQGASSFTGIGQRGSHPAGDHPGETSEGKQHTGRSPDRSFDPWNQTEGGQHSVASFGDRPRSGETPGG